MTLSENNRVITRSIRIKPGRYILLDTDGKGAVRIGADNVTVDFQGARIESCDVQSAEREKFQGIGLNIEGHKNVKIKNAVIRGYKFNIRALDSENLRIESCDASYSRSDRTWKDGAPINAWLLLRSIEAWRNYGAGIWIERSPKSVVRNCRALSAQNGLLLVSSDKCLITGNDFSFNSGWGFSLFEASDNILSWNLTDFSNRPFGGSFGADSSSVACVNTSNRNYFVGNSMTHGGDGFFLTNVTDVGHDPATGRFAPKGGSDDNVIAYNDGSWSPGNAFEGTFSLRNVYFRNLADHANYGFWLGFSSESLIIENKIRESRSPAIAIEHGVGNLIERNLMVNNPDAAVKLYAGQGKEREGFPSKNMEIRDNVIRNSPAAVDLPNSTEYYVGDNRLENAPMPAGFANTKEPNKTTATAKFLASPEYKKLQSILATKPKNFKLYHETNAPLGLEWIQMDGYAPRDFRGQLAAYRAADWGAIELFVFNPQGTKITAPKWAKLVRTAGNPKRIRIEAAAGADGVCEFRSSEIRLTEGKRSQQIAYNFLPAQWKLKWFRWDGPQKLEFKNTEGWKTLLAGSPIAEQTTNTTGSWFKTKPAGVPDSNIAIQATTRIRVPAGTYRFAADFNDGLKLLVDGKEEITNWQENWWHQFAEKSVDLTAGEHDITVQYARAGGSPLLHLFWCKLK
jgi:parallel beta-helix repeat protein